MFEDQSRKIEVPSGAKPLIGEPRLFVMPEKFRGLTARVTPSLVKPAAPPPAPIIKSLPKLQQKPVFRKGLSSATRMFIAAGAVLILTLGGASVYVYFSLPSEEKPKEEQVIGVQQQKPSEVKDETKKEGKEEGGEETKEDKTVSPFPAGLVPGRDTDSDGLTDAEELLYRTSSKKPDTDSDGFLDGNEVFHVYDPNAPAPAGLRDLSLFGQLCAEKFCLLYPLVWTQRAAGESGTVLVLPSGETISISWEAKEAALSLADWFSGANLASEITVTLGATKGGYPSLTTEDQLTVYIDIEEEVIIMSYQNTVKATIDYLTTFEMIINSLAYVEGGVE